VLTLKWTNFVHFGGAGLLTKSSISAIRALIYLGYSKTELPLSALAVARQLRESPSYLSKILRRMVRHGLLKWFAGLREVSTEPTTGQNQSVLKLWKPVGGCHWGCLPARGSGPGLGFQASVELRDAVTGVLSRWTLADCMNSRLSVQGQRRSCLQSFRHATVTVNPEVAEDGLNGL
jgi:DNA-binding IscR family transcriptional regulator